MLILNLLAHACLILERLNIPYFITGSIASTSYGEFRTTNDVDIVIDIPLDMVRELSAEFSDEVYYLSEDSARDAVLNRFQFNVIHTTSAYKIDFMVCGDSEYDQMRMKRARPFTFAPGHSFRVATPEDIILSKLQFYQQGGSDKHLRDIAGIINGQRLALDYQYIQDWSQRIQVDQEWNTVVNATKANRYSNPPTA